MYMCVMYICYLRTDTDRNIQRVLLFRLLSWLVSSNWFVHICFKQLLLYWQEKPKQKQQSQKGEPPEVEALSDAMEFRWDDGLTWGAMIRVDSARTFRLLSWIYKFLFVLLFELCFFKQPLLYWQETPKQKQKSKKGDPSEAEACFWCDGIPMGWWVHVRC